MEKIEKVLKFWFNDIDDDTEIQPGDEKLKRWFSRDEEFDKEVRQKLEGDLIRARKRKYESWEETPQGRLALIILFDQVARNVYRDSPKAFENDLRALEFCLLSIKNDFDEKLMLIERQFLYLPLMHAESLKIQEKSLTYFGRLLEEAQQRQKNVDYYQNVLDFAQKNFEIIDMFERFPHRNDILGRRSTPRESEFMKEEGSSF